ncbi:ergosterol biosynthesis protein-like protein Erg28 [Plenodomus tracheiphilus IPT5]|uniref:Ergosterol biosynthesis protein-like protein Erg28 n=1 Tax=Plenodomus tracheiphilus IPT5 TaxID=1408161 RepID=A0A6A7B0U4_9PLEO|nr:ergosterol biosynthesis protein-like protein Erg28 [Plenodomus tracheiphilus IPT5]
MPAFTSNHDGYLPYFLLFTALLATIHSVICYVSAPSASLRQFSGQLAPPHTQLLAHVYGVKNIYTSLIRAYAAFNVNNRALYDLATLTYVLVLFLFISELAVWKTARLRESVFPFLNAGVGLTWMMATRGWYLGN